MVWLLASIFIEPFYILRDVRCPTLSHPAYRHATAP
jgi:hypothetical protein